MRKRFFSGTQPRATARSLTRQDLIEALQQTGCALCRLAHNKSRRYIETLLDTAVIDVEQRDTWRDAKGFCSWHAGMATALPHSAGSLAILYHDVLGHEIQRLTALTSSGPISPWRHKRHRRFAKYTQRWLRGWQHRVCPVCRLWQEQESLCMAVLLDDWQASELAATFAASDGLCLPHTVHIATQGVSHAHLPAFLVAQQRRLGALQDELQEFVRKLDYRFAHQPYGSEADAWQRAVALFTGVCGWLGKNSIP